ncbi:hypothetical protein [uncultured Oxalicibacterium sp.]|uniref:cytidylyltransferase domain-containing protein n=1 Tax=uncultured Oxalicibacterium sp. TaxID=1168540 RepID=UPI003453FB0D
MIMRQGDRTVALIPLRGGSKSIPMKNIKLIGGKPLCAWVLLLANTNSSESYCEFQPVHAFDIYPAISQAPKKYIEFAFKASENQRALRTVS